MDHFTDGSEGLNSALGEPYAAAVIDIMLPGLDGLRLMQELRKHKVMTPVLILMGPHAFASHDELSPPLFQCSSHSASKRVSHRDD